jgi:hypothetical protein
MRFQQLRFLASLIAVASCGAPVPRPDLVEVLQGAAGGDVGRTVTLADVAPYAWDTVWLFGPYSVSPTVMPEHPAVRAAKRTSVMVQEHAHAVVLMKGRRVVGYAEVPRHLADFDLAGANRQQLARSAARFTICRDTVSDRRVLAVAPQKTRTRISCTPMAQTGRANRVWDGQPSVRRTHHGWRAVGGSVAAARPRCVPLWWCNAVVYPSSVKAIDSSGLTYVAPVSAAGIRFRAWLPLAAGQASTAS